MPIATVTPSSACLVRISLPPCAASSAQGSATPGTPTRSCTRAEPLSDGSRAKQACTSCVEKLRNGNACRSQNATSAGVVAFRSSVATQATSASVCGPNAMRTAASIRSTVTPCRNPRPIVSVAQPAPASSGRDTVACEGPRGRCMRLRGRRKRRGNEDTTAAWRGPLSLTDLPHLPTLATNLVRAHACRRPRNTASSHFTSRPCRSPCARSP